MQILLDKLVYLYKEKIIFNPKIRFSDLFLISFFSAPSFLLLILPFLAKLPDSNIPSHKYALPPCLNHDRHHLNISCSWPAG